MTFEWFAVGDVWRAGPRAVSAEDVAAAVATGGDDHPLHTDGSAARALGFDGVIAPAALGALIAGGLWTETGAVTDCVIASVSEAWTFHAPIRVGDELSLTATIVALRPTRSGDRGIVTRYNELHRADGTLVQSGESAVLVSATPGAQHDPRRDVGTVEWAKLLATELGEDAQFRSSVEAWDGTIGLRCGSDEVHLRIYRGAIIDVTRRAPLGAAFVLGADRATWADILTGEPTEFAARQLRGDFTTSGNPYEYLRLSKALALLIDAARRLSTPEKKENGR